MQEKENKNVNNFVGGAAILGIAAVFCKLLGAFFRIPLGNIIGDDGMGYYQTSYPIYTALLMISSSGLPTAISRMIAERRAKGNYKESQRVFRLSLVIMSALGFFTGFALLFGAKAICNYIKEPDAYYCMIAVVPSLIICPVISCLRGYFQGQKNMFPTGVSQVVEQICRVSIGFGLAIALMKKSIAHAAAGAAFGASVGSIGALVYIAIIYFKKRPTSLELERQQSIETPGINQLSNKELLKEMLIIAIPITLGATIMPVINSIDTMMVKSRLISIGFSSDAARAMYGQLSGMASPIVNLPDAATAAVTMSLVPIISEARKKGDNQCIKDNAALSIRYAVLLGLPCVFGIACLAKPIMTMLYPMQKEAAINAAACLEAYSAGIVFLAIHQALSGVLQGIGKQGVPVRNLLIGAVVKVGVTYVLCGIESINVRGAAYGTVCAYVIAALLNYVSVKKNTDIVVDVKLTFVKPLVSAGVMGLVVYFSSMALAPKLGNSISTLICIILGVTTYVVLVFATGSITVDELRPIKKLSKLVHLLDKFASKGKME